MNGLVELYSAFVRRGDIVFDVGANVGERTEAFVRLGAKVIAVEPNAGCCSDLRQLFRFSRVTVEQAAAGAQQGAVPLRCCGDNTMSSMSDRWIHAVKASRFHDMAWNDVRMVRVLTLDSLIEKHDEPSFIKIDVEGFENEVLTGLTRPVHGISFEYTPELFDLAVECVNRVRKLGNYEFNFIVGQSLRLGMENWIDDDAVIRKLAQLTPETWRTADHQYADIFARRVANRRKRST